ncbi:MAG: DUF502 domain-containing protein [Chloroflexi bacterium]|nr:DUF502 domain-containing protein [Chloroflexota bacterium]
MSPQLVPHNILRRFLGHTQAMLAAGLLVIIPIAVTAVVLKFLFDMLDPILQPLLGLLPGPRIPGLGLISLMVAVYLVGLVATQVVGRRLVNLTHRIMERIPVVKSIYGTTRIGVEFLSGSGEHPYRGVVLVDFPRAGMKAIGLITANLGVLNGAEMVAVYVPTTPIPSSGFLVVLPMDEVIVTEMSVDDAMKIIISGGILAKDLFVTTPEYATGTKAPDTEVPTESVG